ncbi:MAG: NAD+ synthase [Planctomycetota bacterium]|nr:MAG: NAD+ synthase [Planctomycetota bacterium]
MKIAIAQINPHVGDIPANTEAILESLKRAEADGADILVCPELCLCGYPPKDLLMRGGFVDAIAEANKKVIAATKKTALVFGTVTRNTGETGKPLFNSAVCARDGKAIHIQPKRLLPTCDVYDESRYFAPGDASEPFEFAGSTIGLTVCEDAWTEPFEGRDLYDCDPVSDLAAAGAKIIINVSASPFCVGKVNYRYDLFSRKAKQHGVTMILANQVGGNDDLIFDGSSMVVGADGTLQCFIPSFESKYKLIDLDSTAPVDLPQADDVTSVHDALTLGVRDYLKKCGFKKTVIGLSGGIDSAVTAAIAVRALGAENVLALGMPGPFSSKGSINDARTLAENLGIEYKVLPITHIYNAYMKILSHEIIEREGDTTGENIQARIRGNLLMAVSNNTGALVLSTGNKSEISVGYCTLYGDMAGGLAVLSDVPKMMVYELAKKINANGEIIPANTITKPPSAELKPDQTDQDSLPPYEILDKIIHAYVEESRSIDEIAKSGHDRGLVGDVARRIDRSEFKRKQMPPGLKVMPRAYGSGWRMPIAQGWS